MKWYEDLFTNYAAGYDREPFTKGTIGEADFIEKEIGGDRSVRILDIGCGTGRHAIELARRGYDVTGIDLAADMLSRAAAKAREAGVRVRLVRSDARRLGVRVLILCEGAFSLMETDEMNYAILREAAAALRPGGRLILTALNALFPLFHSVKDFMNAHDQATRDNTFDLLTFRDRATFEVVDDSGRKKTMETDERYFAPSELTWLLKSAGFREVGLFGSHLGAFSREHPLTTEDFEVLAVATR